MKARTIGFDSRHPSTRLAASRFATAALLVACLLGGCSVRNMAANSLGDALASSGSGFGSDNDPELIGAAAPFSLKLMESVLTETPQHRGLLLAATQGFVQYSYAFVELRADEIEDANLQEAYRQRDRARRLYLRARDYGLRALEVAHPGIDKALRKDTAAALSRTRAEDVPTLYWTGVAWAAAVSQSKDDPFLVSELPIAEALVRRAFALDEAYDHGAIHVFLMSYEMSQAGLSAGASARAKQHFERALELTNAKQVGPYVTYAESISISERNRAEFEEKLQIALSINADAVPEWRLANRVMQQRARWLLSRTNSLFAD